MSMITVLAGICFSIGLFILLAFVVYLFMLVSLKFPRGRLLNVGNRNTFIAGHPSFLTGDRMKDAADEMQEDFKAEGIAPRPRLDAPTGTESSEDFQIKVDKEIEEMVGKNLYRGEKEQV